MEKVDNLKPVHETTEALAEILGGQYPRGIWMDITPEQMARITESAQRYEDEGGRPSKPPSQPNARAFLGNLVLGNT